MPFPHTRRTASALLGASLAFAAVACAPARQTLPAEAPDQASTPTSSPAVKVPVDDGAAAQCNAGATTGFVGRVLDPSIQQDAKAASGARTVRVIEPGMAVTMDYRYDRLNIDLDDAGRILRIHCG